MFNFYSVNFFYICRNYVILNYGSLRENKTLCQGMRGFDFKKTENWTAEGFPDTTN